MCSGSCERGNRIAPASGKIGTRIVSAWITPNLPSCENKRRQPPPLPAGPRVGEALRLEQLQEPLAGGALVPVGVAGNDLEQRFGGAVAVAGRRPGAGQLEPRLMVVGVLGDPRFDSRGVRRRR